MEEELKSKSGKSEILKACSDGNNWQRWERTIPCTLSELLDYGILTDVNFIVGKEGEDCLPAHRMIVGMHSQVLSTMLNESTPDEKIILPDVEPDVFRAALKYMYTQDEHIDAAKLLPLFNFADKYRVVPLKKLCHKLFVKNFTCENACQRLSEAKFCVEDTGSLLDDCLQQVKRYAPQSLQTQGFVDLDNNLLRLVLAENDLDIEEIDLFDLVQRWSCAECKRLNLDQTALNKRSVLGDALFMIRFLSMTAADFSDGPAQSGLLTVKECLDVLLYMTAGKRPEKLLFPTEPRVRVPVEAILFYVSCTRGSLNWCSGEGCHYTTDVMRFTTNRPVTLASIDLYGCSLPTTLIATVTIELPSSSSKIPAVPIVKEVFSYEVSGSTGGRGSLLNAKFSKRIKIDPGKQYTVSTDFTSTEDLRNCFVGATEAKLITARDPRGDLTIDFTESPYQGFIAEMTFFLDG